MVNNNEAASILDKAAAHIDTVGYTTWNRWDDRQEQAGTPRSECSVDILGAIAYAAHGDPTARIAAKDDAANDARCLFAHHFNSSVVPMDWDNGNDASKALREAAAALRSSKP